MKLQTRQKRPAFAVLVALLSLFGFGLLSTGAAQAQSTAPTPPDTGVVQGKQERPPVAPGSRDAKPMTPRGATKLVPTDVSGKPTQAGDFSAQAGNVLGIDFSTPLNYCWKQFVYAPVVNTTATAKSIQVRLYNQGMTRELYTSVPANSTAYPGFYGVEGSFYAYLYVWNGSTYQYDEYRTSNNTCKVDVTRVYNTGGWVQLRIQNTGTAYATQVSSELAPYPAAGTYTGTKYHYPAAGGAALYQWFDVDAWPYGITSRTDGSWNAPVNFTGDQ